MSGNIFPGHQLVIKNVKPVTVKMWEIAHLAEFQTSAQSYGEAIQWEEWSVSPLVGSQQYWTLVNKGLIDVNEVSAAGARPGPEPVAAPLSAMGSVLPSTTITSSSSSIVPAEIPAEGGPEEGELEEDMAIDGEDELEHSEEKTVMMTRARARAAAASGGTTNVTAPVTPPGGVNVSGSTTSSSSVTTSVAEVRSGNSGSVSGTVTTQAGIVNGAGGGQAVRPAINIIDVNRALGILGMGGGLEAARPNQYWVIPARKLESGNSAAIKRHDMWGWMVKCLEMKGEPGPYHYLSKQVKKFDVLGLFCSIIHVTNIQTPFSYQKKLEDFINASPKKDEDFFAYSTRLLAMADGIGVPANINAAFSKKFVEWMLQIKTVSSINKFGGKEKVYIDKLSVYSTADWVKLDRNTVLEHVRQVHNNATSMKAPENAVAMHANGGRSRQRQKSEQPSNAEEGEKKEKRGKSRGRSGSRPRPSEPSDCPKGTCWEFWTSGNCAFSKSSGKECRFEHSRRPAASSGNKPPEQKQEPKKKGCYKCGEAHKPAECTYTGKCGACEREGHKTALCKSRDRSQSKSRPKKGKKQVHMAVVEDGQESSGNHQG